MLSASGFKDKAEYRSVPSAATNAMSDPTHPPLSVGDTCLWAVWSIPFTLNAVILRLPAEYHDTFN